MCSFLLGVQRDIDLDCGEECLNIFDTELVTSHLHNAQLRPLRRKEDGGKLMNSLRLS